jgi:hypothetical protein
MEVNEFYSTFLSLELGSKYDHHGSKFLLPRIEGHDDFDPFDWLMENFTEQRCFSYWATSDSSIHVVFPDSVLDATFKPVEERGIIHGMVVYPFMLSRLKDCYEELSFSFSMYE